jgi:PAS domain S-box-containing protein
LKSIYINALIEKVMKKNGIKGLSIFYKLLLSFLLVVTLISGTMTVVYYIFSKRSIEQQTREHLHTVFAGVEDHIGNDFTAFIKDIQLLASNPLLDEFIMSSEIEIEINARSLERLFIKSLELMRGSRGISFVDYSGKEKVKVNRSGRIRTYHDISGSGLFSDIAGSAPGSVHIEGPHRNRAGEVVFSLGIHKTDADIGEFGGAIIIEHDMEFFLRYLNEIKIYDSNPLWVFTNDGDVLMMPDNNKAMFDPRPYLLKRFQETPSLLELQQGMFIYQDFSFIPEKSLIRVAISIPASLLLKDISMVLRFLSIVFIISLAVTFLMVSYLSRYMSNPIVKLAHAAARIARGDLSARVDINTSGEVRMLVDSFNKMTSDMQKTTVSKDYFNNIIQSMFDSLIVVSPDYTIRMVNSATCDLLNYREDELIGSPVGKILNAELLEKEAEVNGLIMQGLNDNMETVYTTKEDREIPVIFSSSIMPGSDGSTSGYVCVARDITERIKTEKELAEAQKQLVDSAHKAGMADIATGILHNLGNVLNSVNLSAEEITQIVRTGKVTSFINANQLLKEHMDHIGEFLSTDEKGKKLPEFYLKLGDVLLEENRRIDQNMKRIEDKISTMKGIVATQQDYARAEFHSEKEELPKIINDVMKIQKDLIESNGVHILGDYEKPLRCKVHKYKLVQVLLNLVKNAVESMKGNDFHNKTKELKIETGRIDDDNDFIRVVDNGCGIPTENHIKIFNHGFTTKEKGHGFGLHASANAMTEMGGSLSAESDGENKGAAFTVKLPV